MNNIAILIINRNDYNNTLECITSLKKHNTKKNFSIILIDNSSHDGSREKLIKKFHLKEIIPSERTCEKNDIFTSDISFNNYNGGDICLSLNDNYGFTGANNFGMKFARQNNFKYIMWLNNDTIIPEFFLDNMLKGIYKYPDNILSCRTVFYPEVNYIWYLGAYFNWLGKPTSNNYNHSSDKIIYPKYIESKLAAGCFILYSKEILGKLGGQDNNYFFNLDDADYSYDASLKGICTIVDTQTILYHKSARSVLNKPGLALYYYIRNIFYFRNKFFPIYKNIIIYIYLFIHTFAVLIYFTFKGYKPYKFISILIKDIYKKRMGKFTGNFIG